MGGLCSKSVQPAGQSSNVVKQLIGQPNGNHVKDDGHKSPGSTGSDADDVNHAAAAAAGDMDKDDKIKLSRVLSDRARSAKSKTKKSAAKVTEVLGRAGTAGLGKAVEALDTFGSSFTNFGSGFGGGVAPKGNKIGILAFEVANTIVKGNNLKLSLSNASLQVLKKEILPSEGVRRLVSTDPEELWRISAADKRHELRMFASEVVRFGNHCRAPEWHQLDRVFNKLGTEVPIPSVDGEQVLRELMGLAQSTAELYHELHALDRYQNDVRRKMEEEEMSVHHKGDNLAILKNDLKSQQKYVKLLKKRSLWSKIMEEVMPKLVDVVYYLHQQLVVAFGEGVEECGTLSSKQRLGTQGLALHYANIINQIDSLVSRPNSIPPNQRDNLYQGLPPSIKASLRGALSASLDKEELSSLQIKEEMEKILEWLVPVASNTTKAHHGFGWVGEWATAGSGERKQQGQDISLLQTLHHADQKVTEDYILELLVWLNLLINTAKSNNMNGPNRSPKKSPFRSPKKTATLSLEQPPSPPRLSADSGVDQPKQQQQQRPPASPTELSKEEEEMLSVAVSRRLTPGISKSQEFQRRPRNLSSRLIKSHSHSPLPTMNTAKKEEEPQALRQLRSLELDIDRLKVLDKIDRIDTVAPPLAAKEEHHHQQHHQVDEDRGS